MDTILCLCFHLTSPFTGSISFSGVALRAAFLEMINQYDEKLSERFHDSSTARPYAIDPFPFDSRFRTHFLEGYEYSFDVNFFSTEDFENSIKKVVLSQDTPLQIHKYQFPLIRVDVSEYDPSALMSEWTSSVEPDSKGEIHLEMRFVSPTQLSHYGSDEAYLLPTSEKIFSSLLRTWNTLESDTKLDRISDYRDWVEQNVYIRKHRLRTVRVSLGRQRNFIGFVGDVTYTISDVENPFASLTVGLARFSEICNIGKNRTAGFGKVLLKT